MLLNRQTKPSVLLALMLLLMIFVGCSAKKQVKLFLIEPTDLYVQDNGDICMSEFYFNQVLQAEIDRK
jgi:hypothetical protein